MANLAPSPRLHSLNKNVIHQICSGQVIVTLASAIKELLENSIDAGATKIDIRLKEFGSESIEVSDNGSGIAENDFNAITGNHSTSKLRQFDDLQSVQTYGFRGEALSSLCQLAKVVVHTCASDAVVGTHLEFDANGLIISRRSLARSRGTTVTINQLFHNLPVRRRHLTDPAQLAKEFSKAVSLVTSYCLVSVGVQINCFRISKSGERNLVVSNAPASSLKDNIAAVYGPSQVSTLVELSAVDSISADILEEFGAKAPIEFDSISITGFITKGPSAFSGDMSSPVGSAKGRTTPGARSSSDRQFLYVNGRPCELPRIARLVTDVWRRSAKEALAVSNDGIQMPVSSASSQFPFFVLMLRMPTETVDINLTPDKRTLLLHHERYILALTKAILIQTLFRKSGVRLASLNRTGTNLDQSVIAFPDQSQQSRCVTTPPIASTSNNRKRTASDDLSFQSGGTINSVDLKDVQLTPLRAGLETALDLKHSNDADVSVLDESYEIVDLPPNTDVGPCRQQVSVHFSMSNLQKAWSEVRCHSERSRTVNTGRDDECQIDTGKGEDLSLGQFRATDTEAVESELSTYFEKTTFNDLQIIGQFNLGFILARHAQDLFIIDQHASDEKFRFEQLIENYRFTSQPLVTPQTLELSVTQEQLLLNNLDVFAKNGFAFRVDENAPCGQQVQLVATPMLENHIFGRPDIEEMLFVLSESYSRRCRPSRLRTILASRACRSAIMIGTALDHAKMQRIVRNMGSMEHPWNCPHGRPTMRHLFHLGRLVS